MKDQIIFCKTPTTGGMEWSSGQHRSLPLQGWRVHIPAIPSFFALVTATMLHWQPKRFNYGSGKPEARRVGPERRREGRNKLFVQKPVDKPKLQFTCVCETWEEPSSNVAEVSG